MADEPPEVWGLRLGLLAPLRLVGEGEGAGLMELEEWPSECNEPVDWYIVDLQMVKCDCYLRAATILGYIVSVNKFTHLPLQSWQHWFLLIFLMKPLLGKR